MDVRLPDGTIIKNVPEGVTKSQLMAKVGKLNAPKPYSVKPEASEPGFLNAIKRGAATRMLGVGQALNDIGVGERIGLPDNETLNEAVKIAGERGKGTGATGWVGEVIGDPLTLATLPLGAAGSLGKLAVGGAAAGAASGATAGLEDSSLANRAKGAAVGGVVGAAVPVAISGAKTAAGRAASAISPIQTRKMADAKAVRTIAQDLSEKGMTGETVRAAVDDASVAGLGADLAEATGSAGLLARRKNIAGGMGKAANELRERISARNETGIPKALSRAATPLADRGQKGVTELAEVIQRNARKAVDVSDIVDDVLNRAAKTNPGNAEGKVYAAILDELSFAEKQGNTLEALHAAKQGLDNIYVEGADDALRSRASRMTAEVRKAINEKLKAIDPAYGAANRKIQAGIVAREIEGALASTNEGSVAGLYNKLWAKPELRRELADMLDPQDYVRVSTAMNALKSIKAGGMAGSDTESRQVARQFMQQETGAPLLENITDVSRGSIVGGAARRLSEAVRAKDNAAFNRQLTNPDVDAIASRVDSLQNGAVRRAADAPVGQLNRAVTGSAALNAPSMTEDRGVQNERKGPSITVRSRGESDLPKVDLPKVPGPQSNAGSDLMGRIRMAESSGNDNAKNPNSSASGPFQFTDGTWASAVAKWGKEHGVSFKDKDKPQAQAKMAAALARDNARILTDKLGRSPSKGELYMAHVFGANGAEKLIRARGGKQDAIMLFPPKVVKANKSLFFDGAKPRKAASLYAMLEKKIMSEG